jgi:hypothetical protein
MKNIIGATYKNKLEFIFFELKFNNISLIIIIKIPYEKIINFMKWLFIISLLVMIKRHANKTKEGINKGITILSFSSPTIFESCTSFLLLNLFTNSKKNISLNL